MPLRLADIVIDATDLDLLAAFWQRALDAEEVGRGEEGDSYIVFKLPDGAHLLLIATPDRKVTKNRVHLDLRATGASQQEEIDRLISLGASLADIGQGDRHWTVMRDPEGNEFCVMPPRPQE